MALPAFDTHAYFKRLVASGFTDKQAEAQAELQSEILSQLVTEKLATKEDISELKLSTKEDINELKHDMEKEFKVIYGNLKLHNWMIASLITINIGVLGGLISVAVKLSRLIS